MTTDDPVHTPESVATLPESTPTPSEPAPAPAVPNSPFDDFADIPKRILLAAIQIVDGEWTEAGIDCRRCKVPGLRTAVAEALRVAAHLADASKDLAYNPASNDWFRSRYAEEVFKPLRSDGDNPRGAR